MRNLIVILALVALTGCEAAQSAKEQALQLQEDAEAYVNDNIAMRRQVRAQNWMLIQGEVTRLQSKGQFIKAQALLCRAYPPLVTFGTLRGETENDILERLRQIDLKVAGCGTLQDLEFKPSETVTPQPLE